MTRTPPTRFARRTPELQFLGNLGDVPSVTLTEGIDPIPIAAGAYDGKSNPDAWMGLENAIIYIDNIARALAQHDPANTSPKFPRIAAGW